MYLHHCGTTLKAKGVNECKLDLISIYFLESQQISIISKGFISSSQVHIFV